MTRPRVAVIYHFFPHYRRAVLQALASSARYEYRFFASLDGENGILPYKGDDLVQIVPLRRFALGRFIVLADAFARVSAYDPQVLVILGNPNILTTWLLAVWGKLCGKKVVFWAHGWLRARSWKTPFRNLYFSLASRVFVYSDRARRLAIQSNYPAQDVVPIYNSLDWNQTETQYIELNADVAEEERSRLGCARDDALLICTARLTDTCRFDLLIEAAVELRASGRSVVIVLVGEGPARSSLEALAVARDVRIYFLGAIYDDRRLARLIYAANATVSPGKVGLTAMHSLGYGTPVVTHSSLDDQMPEVEAVVEGVSGTYFRQGSVPDLAAAIMRVLDDPADRSVVRDRCRRVIESRYTPQGQRHLIEGALDDLLAGEHADGASNGSEIRAAYICHTFGQPDLDRCTALSDRRISVTAIDWALSNTEYIWEKTQKTFGYLNIPIAHGSTLSWLSGAGVLIRALISVRPHVIFVYGFHNPVFGLVAAVARAFGVKAITMNDSRFSDYERNIGSDVIKSVLLWPYDGCLAASDAAAVYARYLGLKSIAVYRCAVDTDRIAKRAEAKYQATRFSDRPFVVVARFADKKNLFGLIEAYRLYASGLSHPRRLQLVGYGPLQESLEKQIKTSELLTGLVDFTGYVEASDIPNILGGAFCLVLPSFSDQFGIVVTEAMACGIPVIVSNNCGARELVENWRNGFVIDPHRCHELTRAMQEMDGDDQKWATMSENARRAASRADVSVFVEGFASLLPPRLRARVSI